MGAKHHFNSWLAKFLSLFGFGAITLPGHIFYKWDRHQVPLVTVAHELVHVDQMREEGFLRFVVTYYLEFFTNFLVLRDFKKAYYSISYELEAYAKQTDFEYYSAAVEVLSEEAIDY